VARIFWTGPAVKDLEEITAFIARDSPTYAQRFGHRLREAPKQLRLFPRLGGIVPEFERENLREVIVDPYRIVYEIRGEDCYIIGVVHGSRVLTRVIRPSDDQR